MPREKAVRDHYFISLHGQPLEVTQEVYYAWYGGERREKYQEEQQQRYGVINFSSIGGEEGDVLNLLPARENVEEDVERKLQYQLLHQAIQNLSSRDCQLISDIFFNEIPIVSIARRDGVHESTIRQRKRCALKRLRQML